MTVKRYFHLFFRLIISNLKIVFRMLLGHPVKPKSMRWCLWVNCVVVVVVVLLLLLLPHLFFLFIYSTCFLAHFCELLFFIFLSVSVSLFSISPLFSPKSFVNSWTYLLYFLQKYDLNGLSKNTVNKVFTYL